MCLSSTCRAETYGLALAHSISECTQHGAAIGNLHPVELHPMSLQQGHAFSLIPRLESGRTNVLSFDKHFTLAVDCTGGVLTGTVSGNPDPIPSDLVCPGGENTQGCEPGNVQQPPSLPPSLPPALPSAADTECPYGSSNPNGMYDWACLPNSAPKPPQSPVGPPSPNSPVTGSFPNAENGRPCPGSTPDGPAPGAEDNVGAPADPNPPNSPPVSDHSPSPGQQDPQGPDNAGGGSAPNGDAGPPDPLVPSCQGDCPTSPSRPKASRPGNTDSPKGSDGPSDDDEPEDLSSSSQGDEDCDDLDQTGSNPGNVREGAGDRPADEADASSSHLAPSVGPTPGSPLQPVSSQPNSPVQPAPASSSQPASPADPPAQPAPVSSLQPAPPAGPPAQPAPAPPVQTAPQVSAALPNDELPQPHEYGWNGMARRAEDAKVDTKEIERSDAEFAMLDDAASTASQTFIRSNPPFDTTTEESTGVVFSGATGCLLASSWSYVVTVLVLLQVFAHVWI